MRSKKIAKIGEKQRRTANVSRHMSMWLNLFSVRYSWPEIELMLYCACTDIVATKVAENGVAHPKWPRLNRKTGALNSNMASGFKPEVVIWPKLRMRTEKSSLLVLDERQRRTVKLSTSYKTSMSLNPFPMTDLRPEVELIHLLRMRRHYWHVWNRRNCTDSEFAWMLSYILSIQSAP